MRHNIDLRRFVCLNESCNSYLEENTGQIKPDHIKKAKCRNILYLRSTCCGKKFSENKGTIFFRKKSSRETVSQVLHATSEGMGIRPAGRVYHKNKNTIISWIKQSGQYTEKVQIFFCNLNLQEIQIDEFWSFIKKKAKNLTEKEKFSECLGDFWTFLAINPENKLVFAHFSGKRITENAIKFLQQVKKRLNDLPPI